MVLDKLGSSLKDALKKVARSIFVDERLINEIIRDIQRALLQADVNVLLVFNLTKEIKRRALDETAPRGISQKEYLIKIVYEELVRFLGEDKSILTITKKKPFKIMLVGLFGSGKTTTIGKLAQYYAKRGFKVATLGLDVHRPAASRQLEQLSEQINVKSFIDAGEKNPIKIYRSFENDIKKFDIVLIDTAGRDALNTELIAELESLHKAIQPDERLLVISGDIGQAAQKQAEQFHKSSRITGIIATKLDGTSKAGGALTAAAATQSHIMFIGTGEKVDDIEVFNPKGFVSRLLGMGDLESLLEKAKDVMGEEQAGDLSEKFMKGEFNFIDLYEQMRALRKMGPLSKVMEMVPGLGQLQMPKELLSVQEDKLKKWRHIMDSMTKHELENPDVLTSKRLERIAKGSGSTIKDVRELVKQHRQTKKIMKSIGSTKDPRKLMKKFKGKLPGGFKI